MQRDRNTFLDPLSADAPNLAISQCRHLIGDGRRAGEFSIGGPPIKSATQMGKAFGGATRTRQKDWVGNGATRWLSLTNLPAQKLKIADDRLPPRKLPTLA
jgi:hypothetical protein